MRERERVLSRAMEVRRDILACGTQSPSLMEPRRKAQDSIATCLSARACLLYRTMMHRMTLSEEDWALPASLSPPCLAFTTCEHVYVKKKGDLANNRGRSCSWVRVLGLSLRPLLLLDASRSEAKSKDQKGAPRPRGSLVNEKERKV